MNVNVTLNDLYAIIGQQAVQIAALNAEVGRLREEKELPPTDLPVHTPEQLSEARDG